ncbi:aldehyde dehydrogenase family protein [Klebsiella pneumoniae]|nr:aldehyde dehydrogenase family protein [Klebsiella pneumoniae]
MPTLMGILVREAGKTFSNAIAKCAKPLTSCTITPARCATISIMKLTACWVRWSVSLRGTSCWRFTGQIAAALAAGNSVLAKSRRADAAYRRPGVAIRRAGVPPGVIQLPPGRGETVGALTTDERVRGVMFTGSTKWATLL